MLFDILMDDGGDAFDDLLKILDEVTPLYKHRMDDLPPQLQEIVHTIAMNWDGMLTREVAKKTKLESKAISSQLKQLEKYEIVESESIGKNKIYKIKERFFNIWYLMRYGRKKDRQRVEWLVKFLESWYSKEELEERAKRLIDSLQTTEVSPNHAYHMTEALSHAGISIELEHLLKMEASKFLQAKQSQFVQELTPSDFAMAKNINQLIKRDKIDEALILLKQLKDKNELSQSLYKSISMQQKILAQIKNIHVLSDQIVNFNDKTQCIKDLYELDIIKQNENDPTLWLIISLIELKCEDYQRSFSNFSRWLSTEDGKILEKINQEYLLTLIAKEQYYQAKRFFEMEVYGFKDIYKPIWYALMHLMGEDEEYKKMGSELTESVNEVLERIQEDEEKYGNL
ncbi:MAG: hypothetical protein A3I60_07630 [Sulfuricurvum sp. RIFCSPLOWO2_02_FULL_43_45]|nr:MAG: hypothetical protein A3I60_07630 [Sulfuricurvum sp. RIFCSPLOWO2_02_FULL_43_45]